MNEIVSGALASKAGEMSFLNLFLQAHIVVQAVMVGLVLASVFCWAIVVEKYFAFRRARREADEFESLFWSGQSLEELYAGLSREQNISMAALFVAAMREWKRSVEGSARAFGGIQLRVEKVMDVTISREMERLERRLSCACRSQKTVDPTFSWRAGFRSNIVFDQATGGRSGSLSWFAALSLTNSTPESHSTRGGGESRHASACPTTD